MVKASSADTGAQESHLGSGPRAPSPHSPLHAPVTRPSAPHLSFLLIPAEDRWLLWVAETDSLHERGGLQARLSAGIVLIARLASGHHGHSA